MPASVRRHNLARLRAHLKVTQATLGRWTGRSPATIKAIEIGKLALSPVLAGLVADLTGADKDWLLRNDLAEPMPPLTHVSVAPERYVSLSFTVPNELAEPMNRAAAELGMNLSQYVCKLVEADLLASSVRDVSEETQPAPALQHSVQREPPRPKSPSQTPASP